MTPLRVVLLSSVLATLAGCSDRLPSTDGGVPDVPLPDAPMVTACDEEGASRCDGAAHQACRDGAWSTIEVCSALCDDEIGCVDCRPDQRTCVGDDVRACTSEGLFGEVIEVCEASSPCSGGYCGGCAADTDLVYLLDGGSHLFSFDPPTLALVDIGRVDCPVVDESASPYSMAVDRSGRAWVLFDSGELFFVDIADASCEASGFVPDQQRFHTFGMGFSRDGEAGEETLYIAGGPDLSSAEADTRLATIDPHTMTVAPIAPLTTLGAYYPELTGDGAGGLFGYFPSETLPSRISTVRRDTARIGPTWDAVAIEPGSMVQAWAFARWGGDFYVVVTIGDGFGGPPGNSEFYRLDPDTGELTFLRMDFRAFVGAGVSTCAPLVF